MKKRGIKRFLTLARVIAGQLLPNFRWSPFLKSIRVAGPEMDRNQALWGGTAGGFVRTGGGG